MLAGVYRDPVLRRLLVSVKGGGRDIGELNLNAKFVFAAAQVPAIFYFPLSGL